MSKYTTEIRFICEEAAGLTESGGFNNISEILSDSVLDKIFNFDFPIFEEEYRHPLERKILKHYYTREIGFETVGRFKLALDSTLNEIMPYYNQLYESAKLKFEPFHDVDITKDYTLDNTTSLSAKMTRRESDTPQGGLNGLESNEYMSFGSITDNSGTDTRGDVYHETVKGKNGTDSYSKRLMEYRKTFLNIDMMVINELEELFMQIW